MTHMLGAWEGSHVIRPGRNLERHEEAVETGLSLGAPGKGMAWS